MDNELERRAAPTSGTPDGGSNPGATVDPAEQVRRMGQLAREIGHDMNNCLGIVSGRAELLVMHLERGNADGARKGVDVILKQMDRMKELSDALRDLRNR